MCPLTPVANPAHFHEQRVSAFSHSNNDSIPSSPCTACPERPLTNVLWRESMLTCSQTAERSASPKHKFT